MDRSTIIGFVLIGIALIAYTQYRGKIYKEQQEILQQQEMIRQQNAVVDTVDFKEKTEPVQTEKAVEQPVKEITPLDKYKGGIEKTVIIETDLYRGEISSKGARVVKWVLKEYLKNDGSEHNIIKNSDGNNLALSFINFERDSVDFGKFFFEVDEIKQTAENEYYIDLTSTEGTKEINFKLLLDGGKEVIKTFIFDGQSFKVDLNYTLKGFKSYIDNREINLNWETGLAFSEKDFQSDATYMKAYAFMGDDVEDIDADPGKMGVKKDYSGNTLWTAVRSKYFVSAIIPKTESGKGVHFEANAGTIGEGIPDKNYKTGLIMDFPEQDHQVYAFQVYMGPIKFNELKSFDVKLEAMMDFGWSFIRPISKIMYVTLKWLYSFIPNYGVVIIVFSLILKLVLWPLTKGSYKSMGKMQEIQPMLKEVQEKYKGDMQKMQKEQMKLYKEHGVNPMGFCLPTLLQMPVFFALYPVFQTLIDFRGAGFVWWINDLSGPDTIFTLPFDIPLYGNLVNLLPIIWAASMFIQQKLTMKDPKQKMMIYFMPIMMLVFFNRLNSGLVLYWTVFNILSLLQQTLSGKKDKVKTAAA